MPGARQLLGLYGERGLCQAAARLKQERISGDRQHDFPSEGISI